jgi:hypothetical protein
VQRSSTSVVRTLRSGTRPHRPQTGCARHGFGSLRPRRRRWASSPCAQCLGDVAHPACRQARIDGAGAGARFWLREQAEGPAPLRRRSRRCGGHPLSTPSRQLGAADRNDRRYCPARPGCDDSGAGPSRSFTTTSTPIPTLTGSGPWGPSFTCSSIPCSSSPSPRGSMGRAWPPSCSSVPRDPARPGTRWRAEGLTWTRDG